VDPTLLRKLERLAAARIEIVPFPSLPRYFVFARDGFASLVERSGDQLGQIGAAGRVTECGFEALVWRNGQPWFVGKQKEEAASEEQVILLRRFESDLAEALDATEG
jgi:hypothetical protein